MKTIGHFVCYRDAVDYAKAHGIHNYTIQYRGNGWQGIKCVLIDLGGGQ